MFYVGKYVKHCAALEHPLTPTQMSEVASGCQSFQHSKTAKLTLTIHGQPLLRIIEPNFPHTAGWNHLIQILKDKMLKANKLVH